MTQIIVSVLFAAIIIACAIFFVREKREKNLTKKQKKTLKRIFICTVIMLVLEFVPFEMMPRIAGRWLRLAAYLAAYIVIGGDILIKAGKGIKNRQIFDESFLMAIATVGAWIIAIYSDGDYTEAIAVMLFYQIGEWFQSYAVGKSRRNISELMDIRPDYANIERDGKTERVDPDEVEIGETIVVRPGEKIPIDGIVCEGVSSLDTSALTGESLPRDIVSGDEVISGCINMTGLIKIKTTKEFGDSTVSKILDLVENASSRKSRSEDFIAKFARVYTPAVCAGALLLALAAPLVSMFVMGKAANWGMWIYRSLTFLIISCPCALVISIPLSFFAGIGGASRAGILIKGSNYLETLSKTTCVVFDKTGTLTCGVFEVSGIHHNVMENKKLLEYAALAESASSHPISRSIARAYGEELDLSKVSNIREFGGKGVTADVDGVAVACGNEKLMEMLNVECVPCSHIGTTVHIAIDNKYAGHILISDVVKKNSKAAVKALHSAGVKKTVMLTGDDKRVAVTTADELGIDNVCAELLPEGKVFEIEKLLKSEPKHEKLAFVGDGINDAPVISRADIGIAMGAMGSDAAIEAADVVIMDDDPLKIAKSIKISRKCIGIVYQNIVFAIGIKVLCLILGAVGIANMWLAIFADVGVMIIAVLNAIRALFTGKL